jgi:DNA-binding NarL/FixJ family response regulator
MVMSGGVYMPPILLGLVQPPPPLEGDTVPSVMRPSGSTAAEVADRIAAGRDVGAVDAAAAAAAGFPPPAAHAPQPPATAQPISVPRYASFDGFGLTPRQTDVLALLLKGMPNKLIARELGLSVDTVKDHVAAVLKALGVTSRTQAVLAVGQLTLGPQGAGWRPRED